MSRDEFNYFYSFRVRYSEIDAQGIVFNAHYLTYFDSAMTEYLRNLGYDYVKEVNKIKKIYKNDNIRFFISKTLKYLQIYNLLKPLRKLVLKLLKFEN